MTQDINNDYINVDLYYNDELKKYVTYSYFKEGYMLINKENIFDCVYDTYKTLKNILSINRIYINKDNIYITYLDNIGNKNKLKMKDIINIIF
jgi:hypothetical protein